MDMNRFTEKLQEALAQSQNEAVSFGHNQVELDHLLYSLLVQDKGIVGRVVSQLGLDPKGLSDEIKKLLEKKPRISCLNFPLIGIEYGLRVEMFKKCGHTQNFAQRGSFLILNFSTLSAVFHLTSIFDFLTL